MNQDSANHFHCVIQLFLHSNRGGCSFIGSFIHSFFHLVFVERLACAGSVLNSGGVLESGAEQVSALIELRV